MRSAEITAAPLTIATSATARRPRLPRSSLPHQPPEHHSPLRIGAGLKCAARRNGIRLPTIATSAASPSTTGKQNQVAAMQACQRRSRPARARTPRPARNPIAPPAIASINCSARKMPSTSAFVRADCFHDADFGASLNHGRRRSRGNGKRCRDQRRERDDPQQRADARQNAAFRFSDTANSADIGAGQAPA